MGWTVGSQTADAFRHTRRRFLALGVFLAGAGLVSRAGAQEKKPGCEPNLLAGNWRVALQRSDSGALIAVLAPEQTFVSKRDNVPATAAFRIFLGQYTANELIAEFSQNSKPNDPSRMGQYAALALSELTKVDGAKPLVAFKHAQFSLNLTADQANLGTNGVLECDLLVEGPNGALVEKGKIQLSSSPDRWNAVGHAALTDLSAVPSIASILRSESLSNRFKLVEPKSNRAGEFKFTIRHPEIGDIQYRLPTAGYEDAIALAKNELADAASAASGKTGQLCVPAISRSGGSGGSSGCYVTTAVCHGLGLPDDCIELRVLRRFRDARLRHMPGGQEDIDRYVAIAPRLAAAIREKNSALEFARIYFRWILPSVCYAAFGLNEKARSTYMRAIQDAASRYA